MGTYSELTTGVDVIEIDRIERVVARWGNRFLERIYTPEELTYCKGKFNRLAARFAAKEAVMKALGTGRRGVSWQEIEIIRTPELNPSVHLKGRARTKANEMELDVIQLTLSHSTDYAVAFAIGEAREGSNS